MKPIISIEEARKILGEEGKNLSDVELKKLMDDLDFLAKAALEIARKEKLETQKERIEGQNTQTEKKGL